MVCVVLQELLLLVLLVQVLVQEVQKADDALQRILLAVALKQWVVLAKNHLDLGWVEHPSGTPPGLLDELLKGLRHLSLRR